eukprot:1438209-Rhodomonas_salina.2
MGKTKEYCNEHNITQEIASMQEQHQNCVAERWVRTLKEVTQVLLRHANLLKAWWGWAVTHTVEVKNEMPCSANPGRRSPNMVYYKRAPNVKMIRTFGCHAVLHLDKDAVSDGALSDRCIEGIFLGLSSSEGRKAYSVWCPHNNYVYYCTNVTFDETHIQLLEGGNKDHKTDLSYLFLEQVQTTAPAQIPASTINDLLTPKTADTERSEARGSVPDYTPQ